MPQTLVVLQEDLRGVNIKNCYHTTEYPLIGNGEAEKDEITGKISNCYCMEKNTSPWDGEITKTDESIHGWRGCISSGWKWR